MGTFSIWHWLIVLAVVLVLFGGRGKVSQLMGDFGKGLKAFKKSMQDDEPFNEKPLVGDETKSLKSEAMSETETRKDRDRATTS